MSKALVGIVGQSGSGKSSSLENLPPTETIIFDTERKGFPFRNQNRFQIIPIVDLSDYGKRVRELNSNPGGIKYAVHESFTKYTEMVLDKARTTQKGYDIWNFYNASLRKFLNELKNNAVIHIITAIDEIVRLPLAEGGEAVVRRIAVAGKEHEGKIEKELLMVLFTDPRRSGPGKPMEYRFVTNSDGIVSAKTPRGMFEELYIPNDLNEVIKKARLYYSTEETESM